jgi:effector-binding domain-containing protein
VYDIRVRELDEQPAAIVRARVAEDEVPVWCVGAYAHVINHLQGHDIPTVGLPFARCAKDEAGYDVEAGLPIPTPILDAPEGDDGDGADGRVHGITLPEGRAVTTWHRGKYADVADAYAALADWVDEAGVEINGPPWEVYHSPPTTDPDAPEWDIEIIQPIVG